MDFFSTFRSNKVLSRWIERASKDEIRKELTRLYIDGNSEIGLGSALTPGELGTFKNNFESDPQPSTGLDSILGAYAGYPFEPLLLPLDRDALLRATVILTGRDSTVNGGASRFPRKVTEHGLVKRVRAIESKAELLFRALAGVAPDIEDVLDVLVVTQPRPNTCYRLLSREDLGLVEMAEKLCEEKRVEELSISRERLLELLKGVGIEGYEVVDEVNWAVFRQVVGESGVLRAVATKADIYSKL